MKKSMFYERSPIIFANAKKLRNEPTSSEIIFGVYLNSTFEILDLKGNIPFHSISQIFSVIN